MKGRSSPNDSRRTSLAGFRRAPWSTVDAPPIKLEARLRHRRAPEAASLGTNSLRSPVAPAEPVPAVPQHREETATGIENWFDQNPLDQRSVRRPGLQSTPVPWEA